MAVVGSIQIQGMKQLQHALDRLPKNVARKVSRRSVRRGAVIIQADAKRRVPVDTGALKRSIRVVESGRMSRKGIVLFRVRTIRKHGGYYANLVEFGTQPRVVALAKLRDKATGRVRLIKNLNVGAMPAKPFMRPAFDTKKREAARAIEAELRRGIEEEARLLAKGGKG